MWQDNDVAIFERRDILIVLVLPSAAGLKWCCCIDHPLLRVTSFAAFLEEYDAARSSFLFRYLFRG